MIRLAAPLSIVAVAVLAGCAAGPRSPAASQSMPVVAQQAPYSAGTGVVVSSNPAPAMASAGPSRPDRTPSSGPSGDLQRLSIKLDNGRMVYVDTSSRDFPVGTRVQLTDDFQIKKQ